MNQIETKVFTSEIKEINGRSVTGIASVFGNKDSYNDIVHLGSFTKTIQQRSKFFRHLWQHDFWSPPIAVIKGIREVGKDELPEQLQAIEEVEGGLEVTREYLDTPRGNEVLEGIKQGAINEMSFAFDTIKYDFEEDEETEQTIRHIREVRLWETSDVLWGANPLTVGSRSSLGRLEHSIKDVMAVLEWLSDERVQQLQNIKTKIRAEEGLVESDLDPFPSDIQERILKARINIAKLETEGLR